MRRYTLINRICSMAMALLLVLTLLTPLLPAASAAQTGTCGEDLSWSFADGTLTITGRGKMDDYQEAAMPPWYSFRDKITRLVLSDGLTYIGRMAFYECTALTTVEIPSSVREIGSMAFSQCTGLTIVQLHEGLKTIGRSAFENCTRLADLRLPDSLTNIGKRAFSRCKSLSYVTVSENVTIMGNSVFAYCSGLIRAEIWAPLKELPTWTFLGCTRLSSIYLSGATTSVGDYALYDCINLSVVYYGGTPGDAQELQDQITESRDDRNGSAGSVSQDELGDTETSENITLDEDGNPVLEDTTVTKTEEATISVTIATTITSEENLEMPVQITATIVSEDGWMQLLEAINKADKGTGVIVTVYVTGSFEIPGAFLNALSGRNIQLKVINLSGAEYAVDFEDVGKVSKKDTLDLSYSLKLLENVAFEQLEGVTVYELSFGKSNEVPAAVSVQLPLECARQTASLYQVVSGELQLVQSSVVDSNGVAHFYLGAVDRKTTYLIGINVPWVSGTDAIIPDSMADSYGVDYKEENVDYVITGRKSSWGIGFLEVNQILIGIMLSTAAFVGLLMYALNKRKLRKGYTPGWVEDDDEN